MDNIKNIGSTVITEDMLKQFCSVQQIYGYVFFNAQFGMYSLQITEVNNQDYKWHLHVDDSRFCSVGGNGFNTVEDFLKSIEILTDEKFPIENIFSSEECADNEKCQGD